MGWNHDFINGTYYETWEGKVISEWEYIKRKWKAESLRQGQQNILIKKCEAQIGSEDIYCDMFRWYYHADREEAPKNVVILSKNEYIKNEKTGTYYRRYSGDHYLTVKLETNRKLKIDKVEEVCGFFLCTEKGKGTLYNKEEFQKKFLH